MPNRVRCPKLERGPERPAPGSGLEAGENRLKKEEGQTVSRHPSSKATAAKDAYGRGAPVVQMNEKTLSEQPCDESRSTSFLPARVVVS